MDNFKKIFILFTFTILMIPLFFDSVSFLKRDFIDIPRINKYVYDHDCNLALNEKWACYVNGSLVDISYIDLNSKSYNVSFDLYNKIVFVSFKQPSNDFLYMPIFYH